MPYPLAAIAITLAYVIGSIPFAYLIVWWKKGIDIRTFGSGNVGATNAGRILGFRYFVIVFLLDLAKGFLPTWGFPELLKSQGYQVLAGLSVLVGIAAILGHNYTMFLKFRGGKGVATSLGAVSALDGIAAAGSALTFLVVLLMTRYVSMGSVLGGIVFAAIHFARTPNPWSREHVLMSCTVIGLLAMLIVRHRKNLVRIGAGTEPKVSFRKKKAEPPRGRIWVGALLIVAAVGVVLGAVVYTTRTQVLDCGSIRLSAVSRVGTGHQRAERVLFLDEGKRLAVTCPRYNRVQIYRVDTSDQLTLERDLSVEGKPVALASHADRLFVLQRPSGDARHVEEGYLEIFDREGRPVGSKTRIGFDPDDLVVTKDGAWAFVVNSGHAEGESNRPAPAILSIRLSQKTPQVVDRLEFSGKGDDPERLTLSEDGLRVAVGLRGSNRVAEVEVGDRGSLRAKRFVRQDAGAMPILFAARNPSHPSDPSQEGREPERGSDSGEILPPGLGEREFSGEPHELHIFATAPDESAIEVFDVRTRQSLGQLPLRGTANLGPIRPMGIAYNAERGLIAVGSRNGAVHLVKIERQLLEIGPIAVDAKRRRDDQ